MKTIRKITFVILLLGIISCHNKKQENIDLYGKWKGYNTKENEYFECDIDKDSIGTFSHYGGNGGLSEYKVEGDTLFFHEVKFTIKMISKNQFALLNKGEKDTRTRLTDSVITFHTIEYNNDSTFDLFYQKFQTRAFEYWKIYGDMNKKELRNSFNEKREIKEETIIINKE